MPTASSDSDKQSDDGPPAKRLRSSEPEASSPRLASQKRLNACEISDEDHLKRRSRSRSPHDTIVVAGPSNGNKHRRRVVKVPDSPPVTPSTVSVADKRHPESATTHTENNSTAFEKFSSEMACLETRIQELEAEMKANKGIVQAQIRKDQMNTKTRHQVYLRVLNDQQQTDRNTLSVQMQESHKALHAQTQELRRLYGTQPPERLKDFEARIQQYAKTLKDSMQKDRVLFETQVQTKRDRIESRIKEDHGIFEARLQGYKEVTKAQNLKLCSQMREIRNLKKRLRYSVNTILLTQKPEDLHNGETQRGAVKRNSDNPNEEEVR